MAFKETAEKAEDSIHCPGCGRPLYDRRRDTCGYCGQQMPESQCFSETQIDQIGRQREAEKKKHQAFKNILEAVGPHDHTPIL